MAGRFIGSALLGSEDAVLDAFRSEFESFLESKCATLGQNAALYRDAYGTDALLWQVTRLVVLLHDIGHLPFSHLTEHAISTHFALVLGGDPSESEWQTRSEQLAFHEFLSLTIVSTNAEIVEVFSDRPGRPRKVLLEMIRSVFRGEDHAVVDTIHELMSGELDADRADYVARDGKVSGVEFGNYDLERMADFMRLYEFRSRFHVMPMELALGKKRDSPVKKPVPPSVVTEPRWAARAPCFGARAG